MGCDPRSRDETKVLKSFVKTDDKSIVTLVEFIGRLPNLPWLDIATDRPESRYRRTSADSLYA